MVDVDELSTWILVVLGELDGSAPRAVTLSVMERLFGNRLGSDDRVPRRTSGEPAWKNNASFARNRLIEKGLLYPKAIAGHGMWSLTHRGSRESARLRSRWIPSLCPTFRSIAADVTWRTQMGRSVGLVPGETTFTDNALLELAISHPAHIAVQRFPSSREAVTGADWEWWIHDNDGYVGFRVQAKRANPSTGRVALDQSAAPTAFTGRQIEVFVDCCRADGIAGLYCVYSDHQPSWRTTADVAGPCPHGPADPAQWGCTVVLADTALRLASERRFGAEAILGAGVPWYHIVCHHSLTGLTAGVRGVFGNLRATEAAVRSRANIDFGQQYTGMPAIEPPGQVEAYFLRELRTLEPWSDLAGVVLVNATRGGVGRR
ncbi:hypothetical protein ACPCHT_32225 [Nucisporomicrobium flavum]|uniref:hypothetical protein n=1 Tax=Nucisporomicrobium flavum TaxID=2785915 RepID=UPI003C2E7F60